MSKSIIKFNVQLPVELSKTDDDKWFIASCPVLDVCSQGKTEKKATQNLTDALTLFLMSCFERGTLDAVLKESGFESAENSSHTPVTQLEHTINVPLPFFIPDHHGQSSCHPV